MGDVKPTSYPDINLLLSALLAAMQFALGAKLYGLYLYGSLVWGDFDHGVSDIDLLAVTSDSMTDLDFENLKELHSRLARKHPEWANRIEVQYASVSGLRTFRTQTTRMAVISPGEPFHVIDTGNDWLTNWYFVQDYGVTLFGSSPDHFIEQISKDEFIQAVYDHALFWRGHVKQTRNSRPYQGYAVLTLCRALYTVTHEELVSKQAAANWAIIQFPDWADFIREALHARSHAAEATQADADSAYPTTERFVLQVIEALKRARG